MKDEDFVATYRGGGQIGAASEELLELLRSQASIPNDTAHRICVNGVGMRNSEDARSIGHHYVFALANHPEASLLERFNSPPVRYVWDP